ncbi:polysaccharide lyase family 3 protein [Karstenula rhodostoma CBS 690.94]|uniref:Pectate lyase n=1 Tax=Karstenula rhodostoma CBS 690.94 TaxID=1392251 RepID=A0A9P4PC42_9PLEO|nr:polysaccharide lyase family 3 protein [Karstenula rhodostoma CBS 690.94]
MKFTLIAAVAAFVAPIAAGPAQQSPNEFFSLTKRATLPAPKSKGSVTYKKPQPISGTFDGGYKTYGRGVKCTGQAEGGDADAVFILENGATLKNVIIGADQIEGVHCKGACTIENVWWINVCEDALTIKGDGNALIKGGGAQGADDKVIQHNGKGTVTIDGFTAMDFGKLYRACGNCKNSVARNVVIKNVKAYNGKLLAGINPNFGGTATISSTCASSVKNICEEFKGTTPGNEPKSVSKGPSNYCKYTASAVKSC